MPARGDWYMANCTTMAMGMQFWGTHGLFPEENKFGAKFIIDVTVESDETMKCQNDEYEGGVSYLMLYNASKKVVTMEQHKMVQRIAQRIADEIFDASSAVERVTVTVKKPFVPIGGIVDYTGCTISRSGKGAGSDGNAMPYTGINPQVMQPGYAD
jgi:dihydroneopterin aldolase